MGNQGFQSEARAPGLVSRRVRKGIRGHLPLGPYDRDVGNPIAVLGGAAAENSERTRVVRSTRGVAVLPLAPAALAGASSSTTVSATSIASSAASVAAVVAAIPAAASARVAAPARAPRGASEAMANTAITPATTNATVVSANPL